MLLLVVLAVASCGKDAEPVELADTVGLEQYEKIPTKVFDLADGSRVAVGSNDGRGLFGQRLDAGDDEWTEPKVVVPLPKKATYCDRIDAVSQGTSIAMVVYCLGGNLEGTLAYSVAAATEGGEDWGVEPLYDGPLVNLDPGPIQRPGIAPDGEDAVWVTDQQRLLRWTAGEGFTTTKVKRDDDRYGQSVALTDSSRLVVARDADLLPRGKESTRCGVEFSTEQPDGSFERQLVYLGRPGKRKQSCGPFDYNFVVGDPDSLVVKDYGKRKAVLTRDNDDKRYEIVSNTLVR